MWKLAVSLLVFVAWMAWVSPQEAVRNVEAWRALFVGPGIESAWKQYRWQQERRLTAMLARMCGPERIHGKLLMQNMGNGSFLSVGSTASVSLDLYVPLECEEQEFEAD